MSANNLTAVSGKKTKSYARQKAISLGLAYAFLIILCFIWIIPIVWVVLTSFRVEPGSFTSSFFPRPYSWVEDGMKYTQTYTLQNYVDSPPSPAPFSPPARRRIRLHAIPGCTARTR